MKSPSVLRFIVNSPRAALAPWIVLSVVAGPFGSGPLALGVALIVAGAALTRALHRATRPPSAERRRPELGADPLALQHAVQPVEDALAP